MGDWTARRRHLRHAVGRAARRRTGLTAPLLAYHGDRDEILPPICSEVVGQLVGGPADVRCAQAPATCSPRRASGCAPRCPRGSASASPERRYGLT